MSKEKFIQIASEAAILERERNFKPAGAMWCMAQGYATTDVNTLWCKHRAEVCKLKDEKNR